MPTEEIELAAREWSAGVDVEIRSDVDARTIEGYAAIFDSIDSHGTVMRRGAFRRSVRANFVAPGRRGRKRNRIRVLWQHNSMEPIGIPTELEEDETGLRFLAKLSNTQRASETLELIRDGVINEMSFGFIPEQVSFGDFEGRDGVSREVRFIERAHVVEISPVTFASNADAGVGLATRFHPAMLQGVPIEERADFVARLIEERAAELQTLRAWLESCKGSGLDQGGEEVAAVRAALGDLRAAFRRA